MSDENQKNTIFKYVKWPLIITGIVILVIFLTRKNAKTVVVREIKPEQRVVVRTVSSGGEVVSKKDSNLSFNIVGTIRKLYVEEDTFVKKGELLAQLDNSSQYQDYLAYKDARDIALRDKDVYIHTETDGDDTYASKIRRYDEYISKAEATMNSALQALNKTYLYAPFDGLVLAVEKEEGETVTIGETVIHIVDFSQLQFLIETDQEDFGFLMEGQEVNIYLDAYENVQIKGVINELPKYANGGDTSIFEVKIDLPDNLEEDTLVGMIGDAEIVVATTEIEVPSLVFDQIISSADGRKFVWVEKNGIIFKEYIETGLEGDVYTQIKSAVEHNIVIPIDNGAEIEEGFRAKIVNK